MRTIQTNQDSKEVEALKEWSLPAAVANHVGFGREGICVHRRVVDPLAASHYRVSVEVIGSALIRRWIVHGLLEPEKCHPSLKSDFCFGNIMNFPSITDDSLKSCLSLRTNCHLLLATTNCSPKRFNAALTIQIDANVFGLKSSDGHRSSLPTENENGIGPPKSWN